MATLTRIYGYIYNSLGAVVTSGKVTMQLQQDMVSVDGTKVAPFTITQDLSASAGFFEKFVYATVGASPNGLAYFVEYDPTPTDISKPASQKDGYWRNYWAVPNVTSTPIGNFVSAQRGEPLTNYMPLGGQLLDPELPDNIVLGLVASNSSKSVIANQAGGNNPTLRYNGTTSVWDLSNDGTTYRQILTGTGTTGKLPKWSALGVLADSIISESGTVATISDTLNVTTITTPASTDLVLSPTGAIKTKDLKPDLGLTRDIGQLINKYRGLYASELWVETLVQAQTMATIGGRIAVAPTTSLTADLGSGTTTVIASLKNNQPDLDDVLYLESNGAVEFVGVSPWMIRPTWKATATVALSTAPSLSTNIRPAASASVTLNISAYLTTGSSAASTSKMAALAQCAVTTTAALTTSVRLAASVSVAYAVSATLTDNIFEVDGDQTAMFTPGRLFTVRGSTTTTNNRVFTTASSVYDAANTKTKVRPTTGFSTAGANLGWVAYFDSGPYVYRLKRNLNATGALAWPSGSALLNTGVIGDGYLDIYSTTGILSSGTGPTIVGNVRTGGTFNQVAARWAIGNLNGLYGYLTDIYGTAFGDSTGSWVKIDPVNGVRLGYNTTTKVQIDSAGNAKFTDSVSAGSANDVIVLSGVDPTYRLWIGNPVAASAPFKVDKTGAVTGTNVSFMAGGVTLDSSGLYINPSSAIGGGAYANDHAVRWSTDNAYRTAIWRSDDPDVTPIKTWHFETSQTALIPSLTTQSSITTIRLSGSRVKRRSPFLHKIRVVTLICGRAKMIPPTKGDAYTSAASATPVWPISASALQPRNPVAYACRISLAASP
jgi:hypothetical protein